MDQKPPDVILLGPEWPERALLRAQLIEEGCEAPAMDFEYAPGRNCEHRRSANTGCMKHQQLFIVPTKATTAAPAGVGRHGTR